MDYPLTLLGLSLQSSIFPYCVYICVEKDAKGPSWIEKSKKEMEDLVNKMKSPRSHHHHRHHTETHGMSDDIDENTPVSNVKGPNVFARAKEEIEAIAEAIHPKKEGR